MSKHNVVYKAIQRINVAYLMADTHTSDIMTRSKEHLSDLH